MLQETKLTSKSKNPTTPGYTLVRQDRSRNKGGGLAFLIRNGISHKTIDSINLPNDDINTELLSIAITGNSKDLILHNLYIPPQSTCERDYTPPLAQLLTNSENTILGGDVNAHHEHWFSKGTEDNRGRALADAIDNSNYGVANENQDTRITPNNQSSPDITVASLDILPYIEWSTHVSLNSDHVPIIIKLKAEFHETPTKDRIYVNFAKADWEGYKDYTEEKFSNIPLQSNPLQGEKIFRKILNNASKRFIPKGRIPKIIHNIPSEAATMIKERDNLRVQNPADPRIKDMSEDIEKKINDHRKTKWNKHLEKCHRGSKNLWSTIKSINQPIKDTGNLNIKFQDRTISDNGKIANMLNKQFTPAPSSKPTKEFRSTLRKLHAKNNQDETYIITEQQTVKAIKASKSSKAIGPDGISPLELKKLGPNAIKFLTHTYNQTINKATVPKLWKTGRIVPLLKPKKAADASKSYRPISLLSPAAKILEKIILPDLSAAIPLRDHQHGFRQHRSTVTALQETTDHIERGLNNKKPAQRTVLVAIDLSKAFDTVSLEILLKDILELNLCHPLKKFLTAYLRGRYQYTEFRGCKSKLRLVKQGVPQGGVLSPLLFNLYLSKMPEPPPDVRLISYADDCQALSSHNDINTICERINPYLDTLSVWFKERKLEISAEKSTATLFTTWSNEVSKTLNIKMDNKPVPTTKNPKILGLTFDNMLNFGAHCKNIKERVQSRNNVLKCLAGSTWGKEKEILLDTYKATGRSILNYASPIWTPYLSQSNWNELEIAQNTALRLSTGCVKMSDTSHLHQETKILPVKPHSEMLTRQYLLSMHQSQHPNHHQIHNPRPPRNKRRSIHDYKASIQTYTGHSLQVTKEEYKRNNKKIHSDSVAATIRSYPPNKVLNSKPPELNIEEKQLPRTTRTTLAQLRSGYSPYLNSYLHRINRSDTDQCPKCNRAAHTTNHLFECTENPTQLQPSDLWTNPRQVAEFLELPIPEATNEDDIDDPG